MKGPLSVWKEINMLMIKHLSHKGLLSGDGRVQGLNNRVNRVDGPLYQRWKNGDNGGLGRRDAYRGERPEDVLPGEVRQAFNGCLIQWSEMQKI